MNPFRRFHRRRPDELSAPAPVPPITKDHEGRHIRLGVPFSGQPPRCPRCGSTNRHTYLEHSLHPDFHLPCFPTPDAHDPWHSYAPALDACVEWDPAKHDFVPAVACGTASTTDAARYKRLYEDSCEDLRKTVKALEDLQAERRREAHAAAEAKTDVAAQFAANNGWHDGVKKAHEALANATYGIADIQKTCGDLAKMHGALKTIIDGACKDAAVLVRRGEKAASEATPRPHRIPDTPHRIPDTRRGMPAGTISLTDEEFAAWNRGEWIAVEGVLLRNPDAPWSPVKPTVVTPRAVKESDESVKFKWEDIGEPIGKIASFAEERDSGGKLTSFEATVERTQKPRPVSSETPKFGQVGYCGALRTPRGKIAVTLTGRTTWIACQEYFECNASLRGGPFGRFENLWARPTELDFGEAAHDSVPAGEFGKFEGGELVEIAWGARSDATKLAAFVTRDGLIRGHITGRTASIDGVEYAEVSAVHESRLPSGDEVHATVGVWFPRGRLRLV